MLQNEELLNYLEPNSTKACFTSVCDNARRQKHEKFSNGALF